MSASKSWRHGVRQNGFRVLAGLSASALSAVLFAACEAENVGKTASPASAAKSDVAKQVRALQEAHAVRLSGYRASLGASARAELDDKLQRVGMAAGPVTVG